jgi:phage terminase large subunit-like protein
MKVIVNNQTPLTVEDEKGNVLFQYLPQEKEITYTYKTFKEMNHDDLVKLVKNMKAFY